MPDVESALFCTAVHGHNTQDCIGHWIPILKLWTHKISIGWENIARCPICLGLLFLVVGSKLVNMELVMMIIIIHCLFSIANYTAQ